VVKGKGWLWPLQLTPYDPLFTLLQRLYPKAIINPIIAPRPVLRYGLQVSPQVLPIFAETRLSPYPMIAPMAKPTKIFVVTMDFFLSGQLL
jgi:hypothetical protein